MTEVTAMPLLSTKDGVIVSPYSLPYSSAASCRGMVPGPLMPVRVTAVPSGGPGSGRASTALGDDGERQGVGGGVEDDDVAGVGRGRGSRYDRGDGVAGVVDEGRRDRQPVLAAVLGGGQLQGDGAGPLDAGEGDVGDLGGARVARRLRRGCAATRAGAARRQGECAREQQTRDRGQPGSALCVHEGHAIPLH